MDQASLLRPGFVLSTAGIVEWRWRIRARPGGGGDAGVAGWISTELQQNVIQPIADFENPNQEWRRLFSELLGTFFLVMVAAGGGMMGAAFPNTISRTAAVVAPGLMVLGIIMFMGKVSGAHLNPAVSVAFALRRDFPWRRVPGYIIVQLIGATLAALVLHAVINVSAVHGSNYVASGYSDGAGFWMELLLTFGLVSVILGTASGAQNIGIIAALGVGAYIALAGLWGSPISGASMNPARTFGPDLVGGSAPTTGCTSPGRSRVPLLRLPSRLCSVAPAAAGPARPPRRAPSTPTPRDRNRTKRQSRPRTDSLVNGRG